jgi:UDP-glucose 4-epimerase
MSRVLVSGSEGSLMQAVIPKLVEYGHTVIGVDNLYRYGMRRHLTDVPYEFYRDDLTDPAAVDSLFSFEQPEVIIQAAAKIYGIGGFHKYRADILADDVTLQSNMLRASVKHKTVQQFVYISSSMVYESCPQDVKVPVTEDMPSMFPVPHTDYGLSKFIGERLCDAFWQQYHLPYLIWRPFNIITPHEPGEDDPGISHVFADFLQMIVKDKLKELPLIGNGEQIRCFTWIDEVAEVIATCSVNDIRTLNQTFNIGNPEPVTMKQLANIICEEAYNLGLISHKTLDFYTTKSYNDDVLIRVPDVQKAKKYLGWQAKQKVRESIIECLKSFQK